MYDLTSYLGMMKDGARITGYLDAIRKAVTPDSVVLELGTGTGVVAFAAAMAGARRVIAVEPNDAIAVAREIARDNGFDNIEFHQTLSTNLVLEERADILISDMRGGLPFLQTHIPSIVDARERLVRPGHTQISQSDRLFAVPVESNAAWHRFIGAWQDNPIAIDMSAVQNYVANSWHSFDLQPESLLSEPQQWCDVDYRTVTNPSVDGTGECVMQRDGVCHGLGVFFETQIDDEITISTKPGEPLMAYNRAYFPVAEPFAVSEGDVLNFRVAAKLVVDQYIWSWSGTCGENRFSQTSFAASPLTTQALQQVDLASKPNLGDFGRHLRWVLVRLDQDKSLGQIAEGLRAAFPEQFPMERDAIAFVAENALRYGVDT